MQPSLVLDADHILRQMSHRALAVAGDDRRRGGI
jgi:hypothetical protein